MRPVVLAFVVLLGGPASAAPPDPAALAARIDKHVVARWAAEKVTPSALADDAAFARRVYLDLVGRIPTVAEARTFLDDKAPDKRARLVAKLIDSAAHAAHWATVWRRTWIPQADQPQSALADEVEGWIAAQLRDNTTYDRIVRGLLTAPPTRGGRDLAPATFFTASEFKPENLAANTTRAFLGINLDCAQCHNHPFARWTRDQFWETAAFFARVPDAGAASTKLVLPIPATSRTVGPRFLSGPQPTWPEVLAPETGRTLLAGWVTAKDNPYFARNAVNRVWAALFGTGLVEPLDDLSDENPPSHPELLDELARAFADSGFDLKYLTTAIVTTRAYQLSASLPAGGGGDPRLFARAAVRGLTGEQLYDSLRVAAGLPPDRADLDPQNAPRARKQFAERFRIERAGTAQRSIPQSLSLMNGRLTAALTAPGTAPTLRAVADAPFLDAAGRVESLYLAALGRKPSADELGPLVRYAERGGADGDARAALADIFWALLNSSEFGTNH